MTVVPGTLRLPGEVSPLVTGMARVSVSRRGWDITLEADQDVPLVPAPQLYELVLASGRVLEVRLERKAFTGRIHRYVLGLAPS